jgi:hypothetical protein
MTTATQTATQPAPALPGLMTWAEACERYPDEWIYVADVDRDPAHLFQFRTARVIGHGQTKQEAFEQAKPWREQYDWVSHYCTNQFIRQLSLSPRIICYEEICDDETGDAIHNPR